MNHAGRNVALGSKCSSFTGDVRRQTPSLQEAANFLPMVAEGFRRK